MSINWPPDQPETPQVQGYADQAQPEVEKTLAENFKVYRVESYSQVATNYRIKVHIGDVNFIYVFVEVSPQGFVTFQYADTIDITKHVKPINMNWPPDQPETSKVQGYADEAQPEVEKTLAANFKVYRVESYSQVATNYRIKVHIGDVNFIYVFVEVSPQGLVTFQYADRIDITKHVKPINMNWPPDQPETSKVQGYADEAQPEVEKTLAANFKVYRVESYSQVATNYRIKVDIGDENFIYVFVEVSTQGLVTFQYADRIGK